MKIYFSGYLAAMTFGAEEIVDLQPQVDNVGQVASQKDDDDDDDDDVDDDDDYGDDDDWCRLQMIICQGAKPATLHSDHLPNWTAVDPERRGGQSPTKISPLYIAMHREENSPAKNFTQSCIICGVNCRSASQGSRSQQPAWQLYRYQPWVAIVQVYTYLPWWQLYLLVETFCFLLNSFCHEKSQYQLH